MLGEGHVTCEILRARETVVWDGKAWIFVQKARPEVHCGGKQ